MVSLHLLLMTYISEVICGNLSAMNCKIFSILRRSSSPVTLHCNTTISSPVDEVRIMMFRSKPSCERRSKNGKLCA